MATEPAGDSTDVERMTRVYLKIKAKRSEISRAFKEEDDTLKGQQDAVKQALLSYCKLHGVESVRTGEGLFYRSTRTKYWTHDWEAMHRFIMERNLPEFFTKSLNQTNVKQFLEENPDTLPEGLSIDSEYIISVRKN